jgi:hypothetical protein
MEKQPAENEAGRGIRPEDQYRYDKLCAFFDRQAAAPQSDGFLYGWLRAIVQGASLWQLRIHHLPRYFSQTGRIVACGHISGISFGLGADTRQF